MARGPRRRAGTAGGGGQAATLSTVKIGLYRVFYTPFWSLPAKCHRRLELRSNFQTHSSTLLLENSLSYGIISKEMIPASICVRTKRRQVPKQIVRIPQRDSMSERYTIISSEREKPKELSDA